MVLIMSMLKKHLPHGRNTQTVKSLKIIKRDHNVVAAWDCELKKNGLTMAGYQDELIIRIINFTWAKQT